MTIMNVRFDFYKPFNFEEFNFFDRRKSYYVIERTDKNGHIRPFRIYQDDDLTAAHIKFTYEHDRRYLRKLVRRFRKLNPLIPPNEIKFRRYKPSLRF